MPNFSDPPPPPLPPSETHLSTTAVVPSLGCSASPIGHQSVYRATLPIGFWVNGIIFPIKQDGGLSKVEEGLEGGERTACVCRGDLSGRAWVGLGWKSQCTEQRRDGQWFVLICCLSCCQRISPRQRAGIHHLANVRMRELSLRIWKYTATIQ
jgi:hypothetical protein